MSSEPPSQGGDESNAPSGGASGGAPASTNPTAPSTTSGSTNPTSTTSSTNPTTYPTGSTTPSTPSSGSVRINLPRTPMSTTSTSTHGFKVPIMGGVIEYVKGTFYPYTGGKPTYDWKGIDVKTSTPSPNQVRPIYVGESQKAYKYRQSGYAIKFRSGDSLQDFEKRVNKHLIDYGMDTIGYLPDVGGVTMVNIVNVHRRVCGAASS